MQVVDLDQEDLSDVLCQTEALPRKHTNCPQHVVFRQERQTFRRLPKTQAIVFAVKTRMRTLTGLDDTELARFQKELPSWPEDIAEYKGLHCWGDCVNAYCAERWKRSERQTV